MTWHRDFEHEGESLRVTAAREGNGARVQVGDRSHAVELLAVGDGVIRFRLGDKTHEARAVQVQGELQVRLDGHTWRLSLRQGRRGGSAVAGDGRIVAPMTGTVLEISVVVGDKVTAEQTVAVLTAMKMEHKLAAGVDGEVAEVLGQAGATVDQGTLLVRIEASKDAPGSS